MLSYHSSNQFLYYFKKEITVFKWMCGCVCHSGYCPIQWFLTAVWMSGIGHTAAEATNCVHNASYGCFYFTTEIEMRGKA